MTEPWFDFYASWELFWPPDVTWDELRVAANDDYNTPPQGASRE